MDYMMSRPEKRAPRLERSRRLNAGRTACWCALVATLAAPGCSLIVPDSGDFTYTDSCEALPAPEQGTVAPISAVEPGEYALYACESGYVLTGNDGMNRRFCRTDGVWDGTEPACEAVVAPCLPNPCINAGSCSETGGSFVCTCAAGSGFTGPTCSTPVECPALATPTYGSVDRTTGSFGETAQYACASGFYLVGDRTRMCQGDGTWSGVDVTCASTDGYPTWPVPGTPAHPFDYDVRTDTVIDRVTELEWERAVSGQYLWPAADAYCAALVLDGHDDWRLPTRIELISIADYTRVPTIDQEVFPGPRYPEFWSASEAPDGAGFHWVVGYESGGQIFGAVDTNFNVRCVRQGPAHASAAEHFAADVDTVVDVHTGLTWQRAVTLGPHTHDEAVSSCETLTLAGRTDWRLPTLSELLSIVDETSRSPAIDQVVFPTTPTNYFWSSVTYPVSPSAAWIVDLINGGAYTRAKTSDSLVRCVR